MSKRGVERGQNPVVREVTCSVEDGRLVLSGQPAGIFCVDFTECSPQVAKGVVAGVRLTFWVGGVRASKRRCRALLRQGSDFVWFENMLEAVNLLPPSPDELHYVCRHVAGLRFFVEVAGDGTMELLQLADE